MKISSETLDVLKNFSSINLSIFVKPGNILRTISPTKSVFAVAEIHDTFEKPFGIYNLSQFLACLSMFENPIVDFQDDMSIIRDETTDRELDYYYCDESTILHAPETLKMPAIDVEFDLKGNDLANALKAMGVLGLPEIAIVGDGNTIMIEAFNSKTTNSTTKSNTYRVKVGNTDKVFRAVFRCENLKMPSIDHHVSVSSKGIAQFKGPLVTYYVTVEANSSSWG